MTTGAAVEPPADLVELGVVRGAYGIKGWAHIAPHAGDADVLLASRTWWLLGRQGPQAIAIQQVRRHAGALVARWTGCESKEAAEALRDTPVAVSRSAFPPLAEGEYYWLDLIGVAVVNRAGVRLGTVTALRSNGAQDLLEVSGDADSEQSGGQRKSARVLLVPMVEDYVDRVDLAARRIEVDWEPDW